VTSLPCLTGALKWQDWTIPERFRVWNMLNCLSAVFAETNNMSLKVSTQRRIKMSHPNLYSFLGHSQQTTTDQMNDMQREVPLRKVGYRLTSSHWSCMLHSTSLIVSRLSWTLPHDSSVVLASLTEFSIWSATVFIGFQSTRGCSLSYVYWFIKLVPAGVLRWCQTETPIRNTRGPRHS